MIDTDDAFASHNPMMDKSADAFRTISEVADDLDLPQHVLRFWETKFTQIKPLKRGGGRRYYRPDDVDLLRGIRYLLYGQGYTIKGVQRLLKDHGPKAIIAAWMDFSAADDSAPAPMSAVATDPADPQKLQESGEVSEALFTSVQDFAGGKIEPDEVEVLDPAAPSAGSASILSTEPVIGSRPGYQPRADVSILRGGLSGGKAGQKPANAVNPFAPLARASSPARSVGPSDANPGAGAELTLSAAERSALMNILQDLAECRRILDAAGRA